MAQINMKTDQEHVYYPWFDWLRGILAITVMVYHEGLIAWHFSGNFAVQIFFALSGWLIGGILIKLKPAQLPRFYFNRAMRIWAPYYLALGLLICASLLREPVTAKWLEFIFYKLSFVYNIFGVPQLANFTQAMPLQGTGNHFWSVNAEEQFYLIAPFLLVLIRHPIARSTAVWLVITALAYITNTYASIVFGVLAAVAVNQYGRFHENKQVRLALVVVLIIAMVAFFKQYNYLRVAPLAAISIVLLLAQIGKKNTIGAVVGGMSYPLYLNHWIGLFIAHAVLKPYGLRDSAFSHVLSISLNIGIALSLYWFIDRRLLAARAGLFTQQRGVVITLFAYGMVIIGSIVGFALLNT